MEIYELLMGMKRRPLMYVTEKKIEYIFNFLRGFCYASYKDNTDTDDNMDCKFVTWFGEWLRRWEKKNVDSDEVPVSMCWYEDIKKIAKSEADECKLFYDLVDVFFEDYKKKRGYFRWRRS